MKLRRPWLVGALSLIPFYWPCWYYLVNREMRDFGSVRGDAELGTSRPGRSVLAVTAAVTPLLWALSVAFAVPWTGAVVTSIALAAVTLVVAAEIALIGITVVVQRRLTRLWETVGQPVTRAPERRLG